jgi:hypothetical protein
MEKKVGTKGVCMKEFEFTYRSAEEALPGDEEPDSDYHATFDMYEKGVQVEHTIPLGNLLLHTAEGRIVGIEIFERANEILGTWEAPDNEEDLETRPLGGRYFMNSKEGTYPNQSHAEIVAEDEGCDECGGEQFEEERQSLNEDKELLVDVKCQECGWVHDTLKR